MQSACITFLVLDGLEKLARLIGGLVDLVGLLLHGIDVSHLQQGCRNHLLVLHLAEDAERILRPPLCRLQLRRPSSSAVAEALGLRKQHAGLATPVPIRPELGELLVHNSFSLEGPARIGAVGLHAVRIDHHPEGVVDPVLVAHVPKHRKGLQGRLQGLGSVLVVEVPLGCGQQQGSLSLVHVRGAVIRERAVNPCHVIDFVVQGVIHPGVFHLAPGWCSRCNPRRLRPTLHGRH
mmetsp:Transcript_90555/g.230371  ORF Transcript_90555/g.230371 Transcript_90555/m.230371 type:complete len:235 (-) Transcript_90555:20-724(-)